MMDTKTPSKSFWNRCLAIPLGLIMWGLAVTAFAEDSNKLASSIAEELRSTWGIEIAALRLSAQGYFVDFRYKVIDPEKASPLASNELRPYLIDESTGKELRVPTTPKLGSLRQTTQKINAGQIYFMFFGNSRGIVKPGNKVTVVIGDRKLEHLTIE